MLRLGTRGSELAMVQARMVEARLRTLGEEVEIVPVKTTGDVKRDASIAAIGGVGVFVKELDEAVRDGRVDAAVHSLKDVPTIGREGLPIAAVLPRDAAGDALVGARSIPELPRGARVGTSSLRRRAQLLRLRPDLDVQPLRGNVPTRLARVGAELDAVLLSLGGLERLGLAARGSPLDPRRFPHAPGQGVVAVVAAEDSEAFHLLARIEDLPTRSAVEAERGVMNALGGGCLAPLGVYAETVGRSVDVWAQVLTPDGERSVEGHARLPVGDLARAGRYFAVHLDHLGADAILRVLRT